MMLNRWVDFDLAITGNLESFSEYQNQRIFLNEKLKEIGIDRNIAPQVTTDNYIGTWFDCERNLALQSFKDMKHTRYSVKKLRNRFTAIEIDKE
jgi:hypothetical protein